MMTIRYNSKGTLTVEHMELSEDGINRLADRLKQLTTPMTIDVQDEPPDASSALLRPIPNSYHR